MVQIVIDRRQRDLGGFSVGRVLPLAARRPAVGPFVFFDHMGPVRLEAGIPRAVDVRPHPHIGLATVTYLFDGELMHRDSVGSEQAVRAGEVNWMTAGRGITHSERFERARREGDDLHGIQAWVALPLEHEETAPGFSHHSAAALPIFEEGGAWARLVAGEAFGAKAEVPVLSPLFYLHWRVATGARAVLPGAASGERALYVAQGRLRLDGRELREGQMAVLDADDAGVLQAEAPTIAMALGGEPLGPRHIEWNFVSSSKERIEQAKADWRAGRMKLPDLDQDEFIPLPGDAPPAPAMS